MIIFVSQIPFSKGFITKFVLIKNNCIFLDAQVKHILLFIMFWLNKESYMFISLMHRIIAQQNLFQETPAWTVFMAKRYLNTVHNVVCRLSKCNWDIRGEDNITSVAITYYLWLIISENTTRNQQIKKDVTCLDEFQQSPRLKSLF